MLDKLMSSSYAWSILAIVTIVSLVYAIVCQQKNKERKEFSFRKQSVSLIAKKKSKYEKLSVSYDGQQIEDLTVSRFTIWNSGNRTLLRDDMVETKELTISSLGESNILDTELIAQAEETNNFAVTQIDDHTVKVIFEYANKKDGIVLQVIHTGSSKDLTLDCKIKGGKPIKDRSDKAKPSKHSKDFYKKTFLVLWTVVLVIVLLLTIIMVIGIYNPAVQNRLIQMPIPQLSAQQNLIILSILLGLFSILVALLWVTLFKSIYKIGIPKALKEYSSFSE